MRKFLLMILICIGALEASNEYHLILDDVTYDAVGSEMKVIFTLNNSFTFLGNLDEELIEKFPQGSSVTLQKYLKITV